MHNFFPSFLSLADNFFLHPSPPSILLKRTLKEGNESELVWTLYKLATKKKGGNKKKAYEQLR